VAFDGVDEEIMKQFKKYPIFVSGNTLSQSEVDEEIQRRLKQYDDELKRNPQLRQQVEKELRESKAKYGEAYDYRRDSIRQGGVYDSSNFLPLRRGPVFRDDQGQRKTHT
jgi:hypothetical protein